MAHLAVALQDGQDVFVERDRGVGGERSRAGQNRWNQKAHHGFLLRTS
jgi:hypothetical protein